MEKIKSPVGVCVMPPPGNNAARNTSYPGYAHDILQHAGICYDSIGVEELISSLTEVGVLLTVGEYPLPEDTTSAIRSWVEAGGAWVSIAGVCGLGDMFGVEVESPSYSSWGGGLCTMGEGYLVPKESSHPILSHLEIPLHFFNGIPVKTSGDGLIAVVVDAHQRPTSRAAVVEKRVGKGICLLIAPDITGSVVRIQQGISVTRDGVPAPDGTAPVCDNVLKTGDGLVLDWIFDREPVEGVPGFIAFLQPVADQWRELLIRSVLYAASEKKVSVPILWFYPRNLPALGHISHDTDGNVEDLGRKMLEVLKTGGINSTWCVIAPGYSSDLIDTIRMAGHELAMHYDAMQEGKVWSEAEFDEQWQELKKLFDGQEIVSNKNHYLRWEGDIEFFEWCEKRGIKLDESKGASKTGEAGFQFGVCHPYFPVAFDGRVIDVMEMPTPTQDLMVFAPRELTTPLLKAALKHYGIAHFLFHPAHIEKPGVADALLSAVKRGKEAGMEWWTAERIGKWERARRSVKWSGYSTGKDDSAVTLNTGNSLKGATVMWLAPGKHVSVNGSKVEAAAVNRWGFEFKSFVIDAAENGQYRLEITD